MSNPSNEPSWWVLAFQIIAGLVLLIVGYIAGRLQERFRRVYVHLDNWQFFMGKSRQAGGHWDRAASLADATMMEFRFTVKFFNTKKIAIGLHRARIEFVENRWLRRRKVLVVRDIRWVACLGGANGMPPTTHTELTLPSREWASPFTEFRFGDPGLIEEFAKVRPIDLAKCNAVYIIAETAEGATKRWLLRKSL